MVKKLAKSLLDASLVVQREFATAWASELSQFCKMVEQATTPWAGITPIVLDTILTNDTLCQALLDNTAGHKASGGLATDGSALLKVLKSFTTMPANPEHSEFLPVLVGHELYHRAKALCSEATNSQQHRYHPVECNMQYVMSQLKS